MERPVVRLGKKNEETEYETEGWVVVRPAPRSGANIKAHSQTQTQTQTQVQTCEDAVRQKAARLQRLRSLGERRD